MVHLHGTKYFWKSIWLFELTTPVFEHSEILRALDCAATTIGGIKIKKIEYLKAPKFLKVGGKNFEVNGC